MVNEIGYDIKGPRIIPINVWFHNFPFFVRTKFSIFCPKWRWADASRIQVRTREFARTSNYNFSSVGTDWLDQCSDKLGLPAGRSGRSGAIRPRPPGTKWLKFVQFCLKHLWGLSESWYMPELIRTKTQSLTDRRWIYYQVIEAEFRVVTSQLSFSFPSSRYVSYLVIDILVKVGHRVAWHIRVLRIHVKIVYH